MKIENGMMFMEIPLPMTEWWHFWKAPRTLTQSFS